MCVLASPSSGTCPVIPHWATRHFPIPIPITHPPDPDLRKPCSQAQAHKCPFTSHSIPCLPCLSPTASILGYKIPSSTGDAAPAVLILGECTPTPHNPLTPWVFGLQTAAHRPRSSTNRRHAMHNNTNLT